MDLLLCTHEPFWPVNGGCTIGNLRIAQGLVARGHGVRVLSPLHVDQAQAFQGTGVQARRFEPWRMHRDVGLRFVKYLAYAALYPLALARELWRHQTDALLVRNAVLALPVLCLGRLFGIKVYISYTDLLSMLLAGDRRYPRWLIQRLRAYETWVAKGFDHVFVISDGLRQIFLDAGVSPNDLSVTLDGADVRLFDPTRFDADQKKAIRLELGLPLDATVVAFHGTVEAHHGQEVIPEIIRRCETLSPKLYFLLIAGGPGLASLRAGLDGMTNARILDFEPPEALARHLACADIGMVPYPPNAGLDLVFTLKLLEYLALELPTVTFSLPSAEAEFGGQPGYYSSADTEAFVSQLSQAAAGPKPIALAQRVRQDFSWEAVTLKIATHLEAGH